MAAAIVLELLDSTVVIERACAGTSERDRCGEGSTLYCAKWHTVCSPLASRARRRFASHCALPRLGEYCIFVCALTNALEAMIYRDTDTKVRR